MPGTLSASDAHTILTDPRDAFAYLMLGTTRSIARQNPATVDSYCKDLIEEGGLYEDALREAFPARTVADEMQRWEGYFTAGEDKLDIYRGLSREFFDWLDRNAVSDEVPAQVMKKWYKLADPLVLLR